MILPSRLGPRQRRWMIDMSATRWQSCPVSDSFTLLVLSEVKACDLGVDELIVASRQVKVGSRV